MSNVGRNQPITGEPQRIQREQCDDTQRAGANRCECNAHT
jgi:hypothetical protein